MSRFYGDLTGNRGTATRMGSADSGIRGHIRGWHVGVRVNGWGDDEGTGKAKVERDVFRIYATGGSSGAIGDELIAEVMRKGDRIISALGGPRSEDRCAKCDHGRRWHFKANNGRGDCAFCPEGDTFHTFKATRDGS